MSAPISCKKRARTTNKWIVPATCVVFGLAYLVIGIASHRVSFGITGLLIMLAYAAFLLIFGNRHESVSLLPGDTSDERRAQLQIKASAFTGQVLVVVIVAGMLWSLVAGNDYEGVFTTLAAIAGVTVIASTIWFSRRG